MPLCKLKRWLTSYNQAEKNKSIVEIQYERGNIMRRIIVSEFESLEGDGWLSGHEPLSQPSHSKHSERRNGARNKLNIGLISKDWR
jgi:hypothetical protein